MEFFDDSAEADLLLALGDGVCRMVRVRFLGFVRVLS